MSSSSDLAALFSPPDSGIVLIITVGNEYRSDDGVGPYIAGGLKNPLSHIAILNAGERPENIVFKAIELNPSTAVIIDAANFGGRPGEARIIPESSVPDCIHSTHNFPLNIVSRLIAEDTGAKVWFVGIQYESIAFGEGLSAEVRASADEIIKMISNSR
ncbi:MAG TPA: hydrogenase 3 maturation endopeptidase HyCI [Dissulfurispiraceae bacterium]|nr:hydrogenase 3 maturation endopeptidase HyCI [Dissulfurispiraceae bacterium]